MNRYDDWFDRKNDYEKDEIERNIHHKDWDELDEHEKRQIYEQEL